MKQLKNYTPFFEHNLLKEDEKIITFLVNKIGRKWIQCTAEYKEYILEWNVAINALSSDWKVGQAYTVPVEVKVDKSSYGTKRYATPLSDEVKATVQAKQDLEKHAKIEKDIIRYLGYIEENLQKYWYQKGQDTVEQLFKQLDNPDKKIEYENRLNDLKQKWRIINAQTEVSRWLGYIKENLSEYWYAKGEDNVLKYAKILGQSDKYVAILKELKDEFKKQELNKQAKSLTKKYGSDKWLNISNSFDNYEEGQTVYDKDFNKWVTILKIVNEWYGIEDAMSFGGNPEGYVVKAFYRDATVDEENKEKEKQAKKVEYKRKVDTILKYFKNTSFDIPAKVDFNDVGVLYHFKEGGHNIYGGGSAFGITSHNLWIVQNNGSDGDDWGHNNFSTGGAGAIAKKYNYDETIADLIREICLEGLTEKYVVKYKPFFEETYRETIKWKYVIRDGKRVKKPFSDREGYHIDYSGDTPKEVKTTSSAQKQLSIQNKKTARKTKGKRSLTTKKQQRSTARHTW